MDLLEEQHDIEEVYADKGDDPLLLDTDDHPLLNRMRPGDREREGKKPWTVQAFERADPDVALSYKLAVAPRTTSPLQRRLVRRRR